MPSRRCFTLCLASIVLLLAATRAQAALQLEDKWGSPGTGNGQFAGPSGIAVAPGGVVYVADTDNHRIQKFLADGTFVLSWGSLGSGNGEFTMPRGVAVGLDRQVYVTDAGNDRIQVFDEFGVYAGQWGSPGAGNGQFNLPRAIAVGPDGSVYVTEDAFAQDRVQKFTAAGVYITQWGSNGTADGQFQSARGIAVDAAGSVYVTDALLNRVQKFTSTGGFVTKWGAGGPGNGQLSFPVGVDCRGSEVIVADQSNHRIQIFSNVGAYLGQFGSLCNLSNGTGCVDPDGGGPLQVGDAQFHFPNGIAIDAVGHILVLDAGNSRVMELGDPQVIGLPDGGPTHQMLLAAHPNPFHGSVRFSVRVPAQAGRATDSHAVVRVLDPSGREVRRIWSGGLPPGEHGFQWDGRTAAGDPAPEGMYFAVVELAGARAATAKIVRVR